MNKLLAANFMRLKKSKVFWGTVIFMAALGFFLAFVQKRDFDNGLDFVTERGLFQYIPFVSIVIAVFCAIFVGTEYSDGTIRNKVIVGHKRREIYLSTFVTCGVSAVCMCILSMACYLVLATVLFGSFVENAAMVLAFSACALLLGICFAAIFTLVALLCHNKAASAVVCILIALILLFFGSYLFGALDEPEFSGGYYMDETGTLQEAEMQPNPRYISGTTRTVYEALLDMTPGGQQIQLASMEASRPWRLAGSSAAISVIITACGMVLFRRKDLK